MMGLDPLDNWDDPNPPPFEPPSDYQADPPTTNGANGHGDSPQGPPQALIDLARTDMGLHGHEAVQAATLLADRRRYEHINTLARRLVRDDQLTRDTNLASIRTLTATQLLAEPRAEHQPLLGDLAYRGHNVTITASYKVGKSTLVENAAGALCTGSLFLARFPILQPQRVVMLNYELDEDDMAARVRRMNLADDALERLLIVNLRGYRLPLMTPLGRDWLAERILEHHADVMVVDPFGAAYAQAGGESENDNAEVRRFLTALDEIKRLGQCPSALLPVHTGRGFQLEGEEHGRGATVLDDWADVRMILTRDDRGNRFLRTEGRAYDLDESKLGFQDGRLMLASSDIGMNRYRARHGAHIDAVTATVKKFPGLSKRDLRGQLGPAGVKSNEEKDSAVEHALNDRLIHTHQGTHGTRMHYAGAEHGIDPCPEGWNQNSGSDSAA